MFHGLAAAQTAGKKMQQAEVKVLVSETPKTKVYKSARRVTANASDTMYEDNWSSAGWKPVYVHYYSNVLNGLQRTRLHLMRYADSAQPYYKHIAVYDDAGRMISGTHYKRDAGISEFYANAKDSAQFDSHGNYTFKGTYSKPASPGFINWETHTYLNTYNASGYLIQTIENAESPGSSRNLTKVYSLHNPANGAPGRMLTLINNPATDSSRTEFLSWHRWVNSINDYRTQPDSVAYQIYQRGAWSDTLRELYTFTQNGGANENVAKTSVKFRQAGSDHYVQSADYNALGNLLLEKKDNILPGNNFSLVWKKDYQNRYTPDDKLLQTIMTYTSTTVSPSDSAVRYSYFRTTDVAGTALKAADLNVVAYPNPFRELVTLSFTGSSMFTEYNITDISSRAVKSGRLVKQGAKAEISASDLNPGIYILTLTGPNNSSRTIKICKSY